MRYYFEYLYIIQKDDSTKGQGNSAISFNFKVVDYIGFSGGDSMRPAETRLARDHDQAARFQIDFPLYFTIDELHDRAG